MVSKEEVKKRLKRFEILSGLGYSKETGEIWLEHLKGESEEKFHWTCVQIERSIRWHILPTLNDYFWTKENTEWIQDPMRFQNPYTGKKGVLKNNKIRKNK